MNIDVGCAYWARLPYDKKHYQEHVVIVLKVTKGLFWSDYLVVPLTTSVKNIEDISLYDTIELKNKVSVVKHDELHTLSKRAFNRFVGKPKDKAFKKIKNRVKQWLSD
jgi:mRNA-degrading endonuclease toxin of MazEF toxin-antitoxin module